MDNFDLKKYLAEGKLHEAATTMDMQDVLKGEELSSKLTKNKPEDFKPGMKVIPSMRLGDNPVKNHIGIVKAVEGGKIIYTKPDNSEADLDPQNLVIITGE
jgi:hypothetical protein